MHGIKNAARGYDGDVQPQGKNCCHKGRIAGLRHALGNLALTLQQCHEWRAKVQGAICNWAKPRAWEHFDFN